MKFLKYEVINQIKKSLEYYYKFFIQEDYEKMLVKEFNLGYYERNEIGYFPITYDISEEKKLDRKKTDYKNSIKLYETYNFLSESQASDERLWAGLSIEKDNMKYLFYRWGETEKTIKYRVVFHEAGKRGYMYHGLARLWWFAHLTFQKNADNPYGLTAFTFENPHIMEKMIYRNFSNSTHIRISIIKAIKEFIDGGGKYSTKKIDELYKYISLLSGTKLLDVIPEEEIIKELVIFIKSLDD